LGTDYFGMQTLSEDAPDLAIGNAGWLYYTDIQLALGSTIFMAINSPVLHNM